VKAEEQATAIRELESSLQITASEAERRLAKQQQDYDRRVQLLTNQIKAAELSSRPANVNLTKENENKYVKPSFF